MRRRKRRLWELYMYYDRLSTYPGRGQLGQNLSVSRNRILYFVIYCNGLDQNIARQQLRNTFQQATIEELPFLRNGW
jgi:hypothetical protein